MINEEVMETILFRHVTKNDKATILKENDFEVIVMFSVKPVELKFNISLDDHPDNNLRFQHDNDQAFLWMLNWNDQQICTAIVECLKNCSYKSKIFLSTLIEPLLHGDFIYHQFDTSHSGSFAYPSTFISREVKKKLVKDVNNTRKRQQVKVCQLRSTHIGSEDDVKTWSSTSILPNIKSATTNNNSNVEVQDSYASLPNIEIYPNGKKKQKHISRQINPLSKLQFQRCYISQGDVSPQSPHRISSFPNLKNFEKKHRNFLFQSPSRCTSLRRSRTQLHPSVKSAPAEIPCRFLMNSNNNRMQQSEGKTIFQERPVGMQLQRRHLQAVSVGTTNSKRNIPMHLCGSYEEGLLNKEDDEQEFQKRMSRIFSWFSRWTEWQKELFLKNLIKILNPAQLYFLYASIMVSLYRDFITLLPQKTSFKIFGYLHPRYLKQCAKVSRKWKWLCEHDILWKRICVRKNINIEGMTYMEKYLTFRVMKNNWLEGKYSLIDLQSSNGSALCLDVFQGMLVVGNSDKTIRVWKRIGQACWKVLEGHTRTIWSVKFISATILSSCSSDHTVKIWNIKTGKCIRTIVGHDGAVWCLDVNDEMFATGSADKSAKVWDLRSSNLIVSFNNHPGGIYSVCFTNDGKQLFTGTIEKTLKLWSIARESCLLSIQIGYNKTPMAPISALVYHQGYLACVCGTDFQIYDSIGKQLMDIYADCHRERIESLRMKVKVKKSSYLPDEVKFKILTVGKDGKIKIWEHTRKKPLLVFTLPDDESIHDVFFDDVKVICASQDGVKLLDFNIR